MPDDSNNPLSRAESSRLREWARLKRQNDRIKHLMEGEFDPPLGTSIRYVESVREVAAAALEVADAKRRANPSPRIASEFTGAGHALSFYRALEAVLKNGLEKLKLAGRPAEMESRVFRTAINNVVEKIPKIVAVADKELTPETLQVIEEVGYAFHRLPVSLEPGAGSRPSLTWEPGFSVTYGPDRHATIGEFAREIAFGPHSNLSKQILSPDPLSPDPLSLLGEARTEWGAGSRPNPEWEGAIRPTRDWLAAFDRLWTQSRVHTLEAGVRIGLDAAAALPPEKLAELDRFIGQPKDHEYIVRQNLWHVARALHEKLIRHERRVQGPGPAALRQPVAAPGGAARGPAFGISLLATGIVGAAAAARKAIEQGDKPGAVLAAIPSLAFAGIPAIPDLARNTPAGRISAFWSQQIQSPRSLLPKFAQPDPSRVRT